MTEEVQVWVAPLDVTDARFEDLARTLAVEERRRADDLPPILARRFVVARGILRDLLSGFTGTPAQKLRFDYGSAGKPSLAATVAFDERTKRVDRKDRFLSRGAAPRI